MATEAPTTSAPQADTFDPAAWLSHFEAVGGGYSASEARTSLCIAYDGSTDEDQRAANALVNQLAQDDRCRVIGLIRARSGLAQHSLAHGADQPDLKPECLESVSEHRPDGAASGSDIADASKGPQDMNMMSAICVAELNAALPSDIADITSEHPIGLPDAMAHYRDAAKRGLEYQAIFNAAERVATDPNDPVLATVEQAWATALHSQADAWRALSRAQVSTLGELQQKIAIVRADAMLDGDSGEGLTAPYRAKVRPTSQSSMNATLNSSSRIVSTRKVT